MAVARPVLVDFARSAPAVGVCHADNVALGITCEAYYVGMASDPPVTYLAGSAVGDGNPNLEITLDLTNAVLNIFGIQFLLPPALYLVNNDAGDRSEPSLNALPQILGGSAPTIENVRRDNSYTALTFFVSGLPDDDHKVFVLWTDPATGNITGEAVVGNGSHTLSATLDPTERLTFIFWGQSPTGKFLPPTVATEPWSTITVPTLDSITTGEEDRTIEINFTPPVDSRVSDYMVLYRNSTRAERVWTQVQTSSSPLQIQELRRGDVYQVLIQARDGSGNRSVPTEPVEVKVQI